jgi:Ni/Co efflux regulator RcnB
MKTQRIVAAVAAASLLMSGGAFAQTSGVTEQTYAEQGRQNPNGPVKTPEQLRNDQRAIQQTQREDQRNQQRYGQRDYRGDQHDNRGYDNRGYDNRRYAPSGYDSRSYGYHDGGYRGQGRGVGPNHAWYRGDRMPYEYRTRHYVVDDWRSHHLYAPPRGYQWVQSGGDYLLVAVATGIIASILLNQ